MPEQKLPQPFSRKACLADFFDEDEDCDSEFGENIGITNNQTITALADITGSAFTLPSAGTWRELLRQSSLGIQCQRICLWMTFYVIWKRRMMGRGSHPFLLTLSPCIVQLESLRRCGGRPEPSQMKSVLSFIPKPRGEVIG